MKIIQKEDSVIFDYEAFDELLTALYIAKEVVKNSKEKERIKACEIFDALVPIYSEMTLKQFPERTMEIKFLENSLDEWCGNFLIEYENEKFYEVLADKLDGLSQEA